ncbi:MAG: ABC-type transport auxiliary lipoprotein family protein [Pseudomonadota bacterium]
MDNSIRSAALFGLVLTIMSLAGCELLPAQLSASETSVRTFSFPSPNTNPATESSGAPIVYVAPPQAAAGYDSSRIVYTRSGAEVLYYAFHEWIAPPARMLEPLIVTRLENSKRFGAVISGATAAAADVRVDTEFLYVRHRFDGATSVGEVALRAQLTDMQSRSIVAARTFNAAAPARSQNPDGGVDAINTALMSVLEDFEAFIRSR